MAVSPMTVCLWLGRLMPAIRAILWFLRDLGACQNLDFNLDVVYDADLNGRSPGPQSGHDSNRRGSSQLSPYPLPKYGCNAYAFFLRYVQVRYVHFPVLRGTSH